MGLSNRIDKTPENDPSKATLVFHGGGIIEFGKETGLAFGTGLFLTGRGWQYDLQGDEKDRIRLYYLQVPVPAWKRPLWIPKDMRDQPTVSEKYTFAYGISVMYMIR